MYVTSRNQNLFYPCLPLPVQIPAHGRKPYKNSTLKEILPKHKQLCEVDISVFTKEKNEVNSTSISRRHFTQC